MWNKIIVSIEWIIIFGLIFSIIVPDWDKIPVVKDYFALLIMGELGLDLYVDYSLTGVADGSIVVVNRESFTWYESSRLQLRADKVGTGQVEVGYYGYGAIATKVPSSGGAFKFNNAA